MERRTRVERKWKVLAVTAVAVFMGFLDVTIVNVAFPELEREFADSSRADLSWVLNAYNVLFAALLVPAGRLADLVGRRRMFFAGMGVFLGASLLCGLAGSVEMLVAARILQAVGGAILVPTSLGLLLPEFPASQRATATAIWTATGAVAAAVALLPVVVARSRRHPSPVFELALFRVRSFAVANAGMFTFSTAFYAL